MRNIFRNIIILLTILLFTSSLSFAEDLMIDYDILEPYIKVMAADDEFLWAAGGSEDEFMRILYKSKDNGENWDIVHIFKKTIEGIHISPNDILFVSISNDRHSEGADGEIWRSTTKGSYFMKVLDLKSGSATSWNFASDDEGYVFISEYGIKSGDNARKIYRSANDGKDFQIVYNPDPMIGYHNHVINIDTRDKNIIYQSIGDDLKTIIMSTDRGDTWSPIINDFHPTSVLQIDSTMLWGLDNSPCSGIIRYDLIDKKLDYSLITPKPFGGSIYDILYVDNLIYVGLMSYDYDKWDGSIFVSKDKGLTWENKLVIPRSERIGVGIYSLLTQGDYIYAWVSMPIEVNGLVDKYQGTIRFRKAN